MANAMGMIARCCRRQVGIADCGGERAHEAPASAAEFSHPSDQGFDGTEALGPKKSAEALEAELEAARDQDVRA